MKSRHLLFAGIGLFLSGCSVIPDWFGSSNAEVSLGSTPGIDAALAADSSTGSLSGPDNEIETETATLSGAPSGAGSASFEAGFGRNDGSIGRSTTSVKGPGTGGISR